MINSPGTSRRLADNKNIHAVFAQMHPLQSSTDMNEQFKIIEQLSEENEEKARVYIARRNSGEICVLKMVTLDANEQQYVARAYRSNSRRGLQGNHNFLRYSCWTELNLLRNVRQALLKQSSPCFPFIYSSHFVESVDETAFPQHGQTLCLEPQLVYCIEYLSKMTLRQWLYKQIIESRHWRKDEKTAVLLLRNQFYILFFHIFAALNVLHDLGGFLHNDLHLNNILIVQSKEQCKNFVYRINNKIYVIPNNLGDCLCQLPIICDFGTASDAEGMQNISFREHFRQTHRCAYHNLRPFEEKCNFTQFCDVLYLLDDVSSELDKQIHAAALHTAFQPFEKLRKELQKQFKSHCSDEQLFTKSLFDTMYSGSDMPTGDFILFDCDKILLDK